MEKAGGWKGTNEVRQGTGFSEGTDQRSGMGRAVSPAGAPAFSFRRGGAPKECPVRSKVFPLYLLGLLVPLLVGAASLGSRTEADASEVPAFEEYLVIPERNIFGSTGRAGRRGARAAAEHQSTPEGTLVDVEVIGIVKTGDPLSSIAIIKDRGRHVPCRVGDRIGGMLITAIRPSEVFFEGETGTRVAKIQPGMTSGRRAVPEMRKPDSKPRIAFANSTPQAGRRVPINATEIRHLARTFPLAPHREDGQVKGLRLTQDIMGLREGDRVTAVAGQSLNTKYPRQKLLQITRKYRQYGREMPEIPVVVERDKKKLQLVLVPFS